MSGSRGFYQRLSNHELVDQTSAKQYDQYKKNLAQLGQCYRALVLLNVRFTSLEEYGTEAENTPSGEITPRQKQTVKDLRRDEDLIQVQKRDGKHLILNKDFSKHNSKRSTLSALDEQLRLCGLNQSSIKFFKDNLNQGALIGCSTYTSALLPTLTELKDELHQKKGFEFQARYNTEIRIEQEKVHFQRGCYIRESSKGNQTARQRKEEPAQIDVESYSIEFSEITDLSLDEDIFMDKIFVEKVECQSMPLLQEVIKYFDAETKSVDQSKLQALIWTIEGMLQCNETKGGLLPLAQSVVELMDSYAECSEDDLFLEDKKQFVYLIQQLLAQIAAKPEQSEPIEKIFQKVTECYNSNKFSFKPQFKATYELFHRFMSKQQYHCRAAYRLLNGDVHIDGKRELLAYADQATQLDQAMIATLYSVAQGLRVQSDERQVGRSIDLTLSDDNQIELLNLQVMLADGKIILPADNYFDQLCERVTRQVRISDDIHPLLMPIVEDVKQLRKDQPQFAREVMIETYHLLQAMRSKPRKKGNMKLVGKYAKLQQKAKDIKQTESLHKNMLLLLGVALPFIIPVVGILGTFYLFGNKIPSYNKEIQQLNQLDGDLKEYLSILKEKHRSSIFGLQGASSSNLLLDDKEERLTDEGVSSGSPLKYSQSLY